eukprot:6446499-Prymnesium_polylepis.1
MARLPLSRSPGISLRASMRAWPSAPSSATHVFCCTSVPDSTATWAVGAQTSSVRPKHWPAKSPPKAGVWNVNDWKTRLSSAAAALHSAVVEKSPSCLARSTSGRQ